MTGVSNDICINNQIYCIYRKTNCAALLKSFQATLVIQRNCVSIVYFLRAPPYANILLSTKWYSLTTRYLLTIEDANVASSSWDGLSEGSDMVDSDRFRSFRSLPGRKGWTNTLATHETRSCPPSANICRYSPPGCNMSHYPVLQAP